MAIAKRPNRSTVADSSAKEKQAAEFILGAGQPGRSEDQTVSHTAPEAQAGPDIIPDSTPGSDPEKARENKKPIMVRVDPEMLKRIDRAARRLGISRSAFIMSSAAEKLERME